MKSLLLRLSALSVVVVLGLIAMAHAQRRGSPGDSAPSLAGPSDVGPTVDSPPAVESSPVADGPPRPFVPDTSMRVLSVVDQGTPANEQPVRTTGASSDDVNSSNQHPADHGADQMAQRAAAPSDPFLAQDAGPPRVAEQPAAAYGPVRPALGPDRTVGALAAVTPPASAEPQLIPAQPDGPNGAAEIRPISSADRSGSDRLAMTPPGVQGSAQDMNQSGSEGSGRPGARQLEGAQSPQLTIEKLAPPEVQVGRPAKFEIRVHNTGNAVAQGVEIHDQIPQGAKFVSSNPLANAGPAGQLTWSLGSLKPGEKASVQLELLPQAEGELGSVASVTFRAEASVRTVATRAQLVVELSAPKQVMIGEEVTLVARISNPGTGTASGVVLLERVPEGTRHAAGSSLEFDVGALKPGGSRQIELSLTAAKAGHVVNLLKAHGEGNVMAEGRVEFDVVAPGLAVTMTGPTRRFLERQATYVVSVTNPGTAPAKDVELTTQLPKGLKFIKANNAGHYDPQTHTVSWSLEELPPTETGRVMLVAMPIEEGQQTVKIQGKARQGLSDEKQQTVTVEGLAALECDIRGTDEAIEVGGETTYQIHLVNQGSKAAENLRLSALFPPEMKVLRVEGTGHPVVDDHRVDFEPLARLAPKAEATFRIRAQALQAGDLRVKMQLQSDDMHQPVNKEESTRVYVDH